MFKQLLDKYDRLPSIIIKVQQKEIANFESLTVHY
jgi:hypothetical protein